jgi:hydrogenase maturation protease
MILILGYGNPLRADDGIGCVLARLLHQRLNRDDVRVHLLHQLTPELVAWIAGAVSVIFIDARDGEPAGTLYCEAVHPCLSEGVFTHNVTPAGLIGAAQDWYGAAPQGLLISVTGASFAYNEQLSPALNALLPTLLDQIEQLIRTHLSATEARSCTSLAL